jgi:hypothetical protein
MTDRRLLTPIVKMFLDAADYIEQRGHYKGQYFKRGVYDYAGSIFPPACLVGAMMAAVHIDTGDEPPPIVNRGENYMNDYLGVNDCTTWNDRPERTAEEVITALRGAALSYKEKADDKA